MKLACITQIRNEAPRLVDWIKYHSKVIGFDHFLFYLDNCTDDSEDILISLKDDYSIEFRQVPLMGEYPTIGSNDIRGNFFNSSATQRQSQSFTDGFNYLKFDYDWIGIFDVDEWIVPQELNDFNFKNELSSFTTNALYLQTYDFRPPYDYTKRIFEQNMHRWTLEEKMSVEMRGTGKMVFRGKICLDKDPRVAVHWGPESSEYNLVECGPIHSNNGSTGYKKYLLYEFRAHTENCKRPLTDDQYQLYDDSIVKLFEMHNLK